MNNKHTQSRRFELQSQQGREPTITTGTGNTLVQFLLSALPTQKDSKFWYYLEAIWLCLRIKVTLPADSTFAGVHPAYWWQALASVQVQTPILGTLFSTENTRGSVLGNLIQKIGFGYMDLPTPNLIGEDGNGSFYVNLYYRIPFALNFLANRMDTAPWAGFLEGGTVNVNIAPSTVFGASGSGVMTGMTLDQAKVSCSLAMQPEPEARIHTPVNWRQHITPGSSTKHVVPDMGSPDGLQGIDQALGVGIAHLSLLTGPAKTGLLAGVSADKITAYSVPWRDQPQIENPELAYVDEYESQGNINRKTGMITALSDVDFPYLTGGAVPDGNTSFLNNSQALIFPIVSTGNDVYTSKLQTVAGAKEMNFQYSQTPSASQYWLGCYFPVFDEQFEQSLVARIAPGSAGKLEAKTLNKQPGGIRRAGKLAYTPDKVEV